MSDFLKESGSRARRLPFTGPFMRSANAKYEADIQVLAKYVDDSKFQVQNGSTCPPSHCFHHSVLEDRKANPTDKKDVLHLMMSGVDKETGQTLSEDTIKYNV